MHGWIKPIVSKPPCILCLKVASLDLGPRSLSMLSNLQGGSKLLNRTVKKLQEPGVCALKAARVAATTPTSG